MNEDKPPKLSASRAYFLFEAVREGEDFEAYEERMVEAGRRTGLFPNFDSGRNKRKKPPSRTS